MNPSGAAEDVTDNTVSKLCVFAREHWGMGALYMLNALSIRLTDSTKLPPLEEANHPENDLWLRRIVKRAELVVVCWGNPGHKLGRAPVIEQILREECAIEKVRCFGLNQTGAPIHPLYQAYTTPLIPYFQKGPSRSSPVGVAESP